MLFKDARNYQILFLSFFLVLGISTRDWTLKPEFIILVISTCLITQFFIEFLTSITATEFKEDVFIEDKPKLLNYFNLNSAPSAIITGLSLSLLLRSDNYLIMVIAAILAILSKFIFKYQGKHFFNPANFGIISVLILTPNAWVSPGQWGDEWWYALLFAGTGGLILKRVGRWDTTAAFISAYACLEAIRNLWLGWTWDVFLHRLMSGSLLLFALFMLTDPRSIPNARASRLIWAVCIAILTFILRNYLYVSTAVFWALFTLAPLTLILDYIWSAPRFYWNVNSNNLATDNNCNSAIAN